LITPIPIDPTDAEFSELRDGMRDGIVGALGVPASVVGVNTSERQKSPPAGAGVNTFRPFSKADQLRKRRKGSSW